MDDLVEILGAFTNFVQNERVRSYNEGVDAGRREISPSPTALEATVQDWFKENRSNDWPLETCRLDVEAIVAAYLKNLNA